MFQLQTSNAHTVRQETLPSDISHCQLLLSLSGCFAHSSLDDCWWRCSAAAGLQALCWCRLVCTCIWACMVTDKQVNTLENQRANKESDSKTQTQTSVQSQLHGCEKLILNVAVLLQKVNRRGQSRSACKTEGKLLQHCSVNLLWQRQSAGHE